MIFLVMFFTTSQDLRPFVHLTGSPHRCGDQKKATDNFKGETLRETLRETMLNVTFKDTFAVYLITIIQI